jgi:hypothetical protein
MYLGRNGIFYITYKDSFTLASKDITLMKGIYETVPRNSKKINQTALDIQREWLYGEDST